MKYTFEELRTIAEELNASLPMKENGEEVGVDDYSSDRPEELAEAVLRAFEENIPQNREDEVPDSVLEFYMEMVPQEEIVDLEKEEKEEKEEKIEEVEEPEKVLEEKEDKRKVVEEMEKEEINETISKWGHQTKKLSGLMDTLFENEVLEDVLLKEVMTKSGKDEKWAHGRIKSHVNHLLKDKKVKIVCKDKVWQEGESNE